jgi:hypothetical protein
LNRQNAKDANKNESQAQPPIKLFLGALGVLAFHHSSSSSIQNPKSFIHNFSFLFSASSSATSAPPRFASIPSPDGETETNMTTP